MIYKYESVNRVLLIMYCTLYTFTFNKKQDDIKNYWPFSQK